MQFKVGNPSLQKHAFTYAVQWNSTWSVLFIYANIGSINATRVVFIISLY